MFVLLFDLGFFLAGVLCLWLVVCFPFSSTFNSFLLMKEKGGDKELISCLQSHLLWMQSVLKQMGTQIKKKL